jgi:hypothetical protein
MTSRVTPEMWMPERCRQASIAAMRPTSRIRHIGYVTPDLAGDYVPPHTIDVPAPGLQLLDLSRVGHPLTPSLYSRVVQHVLAWTPWGASRLLRKWSSGHRAALTRARWQLGICACWRVPWAPAMGMEPRGEMPAGARPVPVSLVGETAPPSSDPRGSVSIRWGGCLSLFCPKQTTTFSAFRAA